MVPDTGGQAHFILAGEEGPDGPGAITWGAAEFIAAEEMARSRGFWWSPDGRSLLAARADNGPVGTWWTSDPSQPASPPRPHRYPAAGTADALVSLWYMEVSPKGGRRGQVTWDSSRFPYLVAVHWSRWGPPLLLVEQRDHKAAAVLAVDVPEDGVGPMTGMGTGQTPPLPPSSRSATPPGSDWPGGVPAWLESGELLWAVSDGCDVAAEGGR